MDVCLKPYEPDPIDPIDPFESDPIDPGVAVLGCD